MTALLALCIPALLAPVPKMKTEPLTAGDRAAVRRAVYELELTVYRDQLPVRPVPGQPAVQPPDQLKLPEAIVAAGRKNRAETEDLLWKIAEGGNPSDSIKAASYLFEMVDPGTGEMITSRLVQAIEPNQREGWDKFNEFWKNTPREQWLGQLDEIRKKARKGGEK